MAQIKTSVFVPDAVTVTVLKEHDPSSFYRTHSGLWVSEGFRELVVAKARPTEAGTKFALKPRSLGRNAADKEIEGELEEMLGKSKHLFDETTVSAVVARLIDGQPTGESGPLLNNGYANLFYTASSVVCVHWYSDRRRWYVNTWRRDGPWWGAGRQVFSPGN